MAKRFAVMGAGELGFHLSRTLQQDGHDVVLIDTDPNKRARVEDELDLSFIVGSGTQIPVLEQADVASCELFIAASNSEEANLVSSVLAKDLGVKRTAVRLETPEELPTFRAPYERRFRAELLLSPQVLATTQILNRVLGHNTHEIDYLAQGRIQLRTIEIQHDAELTRNRLRDVPLPAGARIVGYLDSHHELSTPSADQRATAGGQALVLCTIDSIREVERMFSSKIPEPQNVVVAGGGATGVSIAEALLGEINRVKIVERDRARASWVANRLTRAEVIHGDATEVSLLRSERIDQADSLIAAMGHDETNLMAALIAQEIGVKQVVALVRRTETNRLWTGAGGIHTVSPRFLAAERIGDYIRNGYKANMISLEGGALRVIQRRIFEASPVVGATLAGIAPPDGLVVGALVRGDRVFVPAADDRIEVGDLAVLFVHQSELATVQLFFPGPEAEA